MDIWKYSNWNKEINLNNNSSGLVLRFEKGIDPEVKRACIEFCKWLRTQYFFPLRVRIYFKASRYIISKSGEKFSAIFFEPFDKNIQSYIRIATDDLKDIELESGKDNALASVLGSIAHELTHYFQWINDIKLTEKGYELQAYYYVNKIVDKYAETREHP